MSWNTSWGLYGNADTSISNFLGTTDARPLLIKTSDRVALRVSAGGDVGVGLPGGTRSPDYKLDVAGVLNADEVYKNGAPLVGSRWQEVTGGIAYKGNVGVGTTSPGARLHVGGGGSVRWGNNGELVADQGGSIELGGNNVTPGTGTPYIDFHFRDLTQDFNTRIVNDANERLSLVASTLQATGNVGIGTSSPQRALSVNAALNVDQANANNGAVNPGVTFGSSSGEGISSKRTAGGNQAGLDLYTNNAARLSVTNGGNVGIGTTAPGARLDVSGSGGAVQCCAPVAPTLSLAEASSSANRQSWLQFHNVNEAEAYVRLAGGGPAGSGRDGQRRLEIGDSQGKSTSLTVQGNVGVGKVDPQARLDVAGGVLLSGNHDVTMRRGMLRMGTTDGSQAAADEVVGAVGFWGYGRQHGQLSFRAGRGFELVDRSAGSPSLNYAHDSQPYASLKLRDLLTTGNVGVGVPEPRAKLHVAGGLWNPTDTEGDVKVGDATYRLKIGVATGGGGAGDVRIRAHGGTNRLMLGSGTLDTLFVNGDRVGVGVMEPQARLHLASEEPQLRIDGAGNRTIVQVARGGALQWDFGVGTDVGNANFWFGDFSAYRLVLEKGTGHVGIGVVDPEARLHVAGGDIRLEGGRTFYSPGRVHVHGEEILYLLNLQGVVISRAWGGNGNLTVEGGAWKPGGGPFSVSSDVRLKKGIEPLRGALERLSRLRGVSFEWKEPEEQGNLTGSQMGLIAQEVEAVLPEWVEKDRNGYKMLTIRGFEALAVEAFKDLKRQNDEFRYRIEALERA